MSAQPNDLNARINELAADYARIFKAGHDEGYRAGFAEGVRQAQKIVEQTVGSFPGVKS